MKTKECSSTKDERIEKESTTPTTTKQTETGKSTSEKTGHHTFGVRRRRIAECSITKTKP